VRATREYNEAKSGAFIPLPVCSTPARPWRSGGENDTATVRCWTRRRASVCCLRAWVRARACASSSSPKDWAFPSCTCARERTSSGSTTSTKEDDRPAGRQRVRLRNKECGGGDRAHVVKAVAPAKARHGSLASFTTAARATTCTGHSPSARRPGPPQMSGRVRPHLGDLRSKCRHR
jgi:hypothetical protein